MGAVHVTHRSTVCTNKTPKNRANKGEIIYRKKISNVAALKSGNHKATTLWLFATLILGVVFIFNQFSGFQEIIDLGYNFTGPTSNVTMSYIYLIAIVHILHVVVGLICLLVVIYNHFKQKYNPTNMLGLELVATFWHFIDILWVYLFLFLYFVR